MRSNLPSKILIFTGLIFIACLLTTSCTHDNIPRQKAYQRVYLPKKEYKQYRSACPFQFEIPIYSEIEDKTTFHGQRLIEDTCWFNIVFPELNGKIYMSYKYYPDQEMLTKLLEDAYRMTSKHMVKASYIKDSVIDKENLKGLIYSVGGNSASEKQFVLTDYKHHFVRGALYFNSTPNYDSMQPVLDFVDKDIYHLINTFKFN
jgi:gliding motility-associated lipoprotein GldD